MTTGTKVFLTIFAVLVGLLVLYYGVLMPAGAAADLPVETAASEGLVDPVAAAETPAGRRPGTREPEPVTERPVLLVPPEEDLSVPRGDVTPVSPTSSVLGTDGLGPAPPPAVTTTTMNPTIGTESPRGEPVDPIRPPVTDPQAGPARANVAADIRDIGPPPRPVEDPVRAAATPQATPPATATPVPRDPLRYTEYVVQEGDTLSGIALEWYGDASSWQEIAQANPTVDPIRMRIGQVLRLPPRGSDRGQATPARRSGEREIIYVVQSGDTLSAIARMYYQDSGKWRVIHATNRRVIGPEPDRLEVGMRLVIPPPFPTTQASR